MSGPSVVQLSVAVLPGKAHAVLCVLSKARAVLLAADCDLQAQCDEATGKCVHIPDDAACTSSGKSCTATKISYMLVAKLSWELAVLPAA